jgi:hypothetical protein
MNKFPQAPAYTIRAVSNFLENSQEIFTALVDKFFPSSSLYLRCQQSDTLIMFPLFAANINNTSSTPAVAKFSTGVVDTGGGDAPLLANISKNFRKKFK